MEITPENLVVGQSYTINGLSGMVYKYRLYSVALGCVQYWFFHVDGFFTSGLQGKEISRFVVLTELMQ